ncbi:MAG: MlaD family protein [Opitutales bacterium]|nr:MlaD family protein [Opitutales bacterium]MDP4644842.1 MlaD family protein [Opitutales bacterium]MDP4776850.1 MlaD family protein [Opitutales bacterium]MDP4883284.1 MlaD family protein [Opitutales bacterium]MDP5080092.1 MlaD family protein [Opitutales bacterium]
MNRKPSPKAIGIFVTAATILLVAMVIFFGSTTLLSKSTRFILFFDQSVNGLAAGSPVKFRGVPVGSVEKILIRAEGQVEGSTAIPVIIKLDRSRLEKELGVPASAFSPESIHTSIERGLMAQLNLESFITGQLFVEFSFEPEKQKGWKPQLAEVNGMLEIPTLASSLDQITGDIAQLISDAGAIDIPRLNENINAVLENLATVLAGIDSEGISDSVTSAADQVTAIVGSDDFKQSITAMRQAFELIGTTAKTFNLKEGPMAATIEKWTTQYEQTLAGLDRLIDDTGNLMSPESDLRYEFETTLRELSRAAQSIRLLADYLERNPNALLTGRPEDEN